MIRILAISLIAVTLAAGEAGGQSTPPPVNPHGFFFGVDLGVMGTPKLSKCPECLPTGRETLLDASHSVAIRIGFSPTSRTLVGLEQSRGVATGGDLNIGAALLIAQHYPTDGGVFLRGGFGALRGAFPKTAGGEDRFRSPAIMLAAGYDTRCLAYGLRSTDCTRHFAIIPTLMFVSGTAPARVPGEATSVFASSDRLSYVALMLGLHWY